MHRYAIWAFALAAAATTWAYALPLIDFGWTTWETKPHYQHFPFVILAAVLLFAQRLTAPNSGAPPGRWWAPLALVLAWLVLVAAFLFVSRLLAAVSAVLFAGAYGVALSQKLKVPFPLGPWLLLWLVLPPPLGLDSRLIEHLQRWSSVLASFALDAVGVNHLMDGNALVLPGKTLFVDEACSGIVSAVSIISCAAMYGVWRRRGLAKTLLLMGLSAGWAVLMNVVRITAIALAQELAGWDWSEGVSHTAVGLVGFGFALLTVYTSDWLVNAVLAPIGDRWAMLTGEPMRFGGSLVRAWDFMVDETEVPPPTSIHSRRLHWQSLTSVSRNPLSAAAIAIAFATIGVANTIAPASEAQPSSDFPPTDALVAALLDPTHMPGAIEGLKLESVEPVERGEDSLFALNSVAFHYADSSGKRYVISCDFPYAGGWHELSVCYQGNGWRVDRREIESLKNSEGVPFDAAFLELSKPHGGYSLVAFCANYPDGKPLTAPATRIADRLIYALSRRNLLRYGDTYQTQVFTVSDAPTTAPEREKCERLLEAAQSAFVAVVSSRNKESSPSSGAATNPL